MLDNYAVHELGRKHNSLSLYITALMITDKIFRSGQREDHTASYFSHNNVQATKLRDQLANDSLEMLIHWLKEGGNVGIHGKFVNFS